MSPRSSPAVDAIDDEERPGFDSRRPLTAVLKVEGADCVCPAVDTGDSTPPLDHHIIDDTCHVTSCGSIEDAAVHYRRTTVDGECVCRIVASHGCNPSLQVLGEQSVVVRTNPPDKETLREVVTDIREIAESVRLQQLVRGGPGDRRSELVDLDNLTETERETIDWAIVAGYYDRPRSIDFEELADEIGISKSALSKRLSAAEAKIMRDLFSDEP
ncbi:helix-turn-helix domain-containing protein [Halorhabdus sp. CUG00001]|uniref:helix-turn-helix domain-containing protein n=1 Tax=Halorhabdus sp. CUG00001 TaxID=2600297 RepID=UPI00131C7ECC|nr:helix-turn-helix domain-containing protein [Halorhabdus sp. CUG00001]